MTKSSAVALGICPVTHTGFYFIGSYTIAKHYPLYSYGLWRGNQDSFIHIFVSSCFKQYGDFFDYKRRICCSIQTEKSLATADAQSRSMPSISGLAKQFDLDSYGLSYHQHKLVPQKDPIAALTSG